MEEQERDDFESVLDRCLQRMRRGEATVEACLAAYPRHAASLRPLLELARDLIRVPIPSARPHAYAAGRARLLAAVTARERRTKDTRRAGVRAWWERVSGQLSLSSRGLRLALVTITALMLCAVSFGWGAWRAAAVPRTATLTQATGTVGILPQGDSTWHTARPGAVIAAGDRLRTGEASLAALLFADGSTTELGAGTGLTMVAMQSRRDGGGSVVRLYQQSGETHHHVTPRFDPGSAFQVETAAALAQVRGTDFVVRVDEASITYVSVTAGIVSVTSGEVTCEVSPGETATVKPGETPTQATITPPRPSETSHPSEAPQGPTATPEPSATLQAPSETAWPSETPQGPKAVPGSTGTSQAPSRTPRPSETPRGPNATPESSATPQAPRETLRPSETPQGPNATPGSTGTSQAPSRTPRPSETPRGPNATPSATGTSRAPSETPGPTETPQGTNATPGSTGTSQAPNETPGPTETLHGPNTTPGPTGTSQAPSETPGPTETLHGPNTTPGPTETPQRPPQTPGSSGTPSPRQPSATPRR